jgi:hypothetical protein
MAIVPRWVQVFGIQIFALGAVLLISWHLVVSFYPQSKSIIDNSRLDPNKHVSESPAQNEFINDGSHMEGEGASGNVQFKGKDILLVVGTDGNSHRDILGMEMMVRQNRHQYAQFHGTPLKHWDSW